MDARIAAGLDRAAAMGETAVQVAAYLGPALIVDAWTGTADPSTGRLADGDTLFPVFSVTKAVTAVALHVQAERGLVDYDAPVARYWPEYGANGKDRITVRHLLTHRSGVPQMPAGVTAERLGDWDWMVGQLAAAEPVFPPGTGTAYQAASFGWLVGEVVRRTDPRRRDFRTFVLEEIAGPLSIPDLWLGIRPEDDGRVARLDTDYTFSGQPSPLARRASPPGTGAAIFNRPEVRTICHPAAGGLFTARSQARFFAMLANRGELDGVRLLSPERVMSFTTLRERPDEVDQVLGFPTTNGIGGFRIGGPCPPADPVVGASPHTLYHTGAGGSVGWADTDTGLSVAICHNRMFSTASKDPADNPFSPLGDAVRAVAAERLAATRTGL